MKPIIGVMPLWDEERDSIWMLPGYMDAVIEAGGTPVIFPFLNRSDREETYRLVKMCDGILFTGGQDVSPELYHEEPLDASVSCCEKRDGMELNVLSAAISAEKPILGICRGIQFINAAMGGTLYQDLPSQHPSETVHRQQAPYDRPVHTVELVKDSPLYKCLGAKTLPVNSFHHQAVKTASDRLKPMAISSDGIIEALYMPEYGFLWAVQWHPEYSHKTDENSRKIFRAFIEAAESKPLNKADVPKK